jgi:hypothetical protein
LSKITISGKQINGSHIHLLKNLRQTNQKKEKKKEMDVSSENKNGEVKNKKKII